MPITAFPTPPAPSDSPAAFNTKAFALLGALPNFVTEANNLEAESAAAATSAANAVLAGKLDKTNPSYTGTLTGGTGVINIGSGQLVKDASGNLGVGTTSPVGKLHSEVSGAEALVFGSATRKLYGRADSGGVSLFTGATQTGTGWYFDDVNNAIKAYTNGVNVGTWDTYGGLSVKGSITAKSRVANGGVSNTASSSNWFYIGQLHLDDSSPATLRVLGASGYGTESSIGGETTVYLRGDNADSLQGTFYGITGGKTSVSGVAWKSVGGPTFELWLKPGAGFESLCVLADLGNASSYYDPAGADTGSVTQPAGSTALSSKLTWNIAGSPSMTLDASGSLLIGTTISPGTSGSVGVRKGGAGQLVLVADNGGLYHQDLSSYYLVTTAGGSTSDASLKTNVRQLTGALAKVCAIRGVNYEFIDTQKCTADQGNQLGVIAQEVEAQYPEIVLTNEDGVKTVRYDRLVAPLIEAVKEQQAQINALMARIEALEAK